MLTETLKWKPISRQGLHERIVGALADMPERLRQVFVLTHYEGLSDSDLALQMGLGRLELASLLSEANSAFRSALEEKRVS